LKKKIKNKNLKIPSQGIKNGCGTLGISVAFFLNIIFRAFSVIIAIFNYLKHTFLIQTLTNYLLIIFQNFEGHQNQ